MKVVIAPDSFKGSLSALEVALAIEKSIRKVKQNIPIIAIAGSLEENYQSLYDKGFDSIFSICNGPMKLEEAIENAERLLEETAENIIRFWNRKKVQ